MKLNFASEVNIFKALPPVNVNDSLIQKFKNKSTNAKKRAPETVDHEPSLEDYLVPLGNIEYELKINNSNLIEGDYNAKHVIVNNFQNIYGLYRQFFDPKYLYEFV